MEAVVAWRYALNNALEQLQAAGPLAPLEQVKAVEDLLLKLDSLTHEDDEERAAARYKSLMKKCRKAMEGSLGDWLSQQSTVEIDDSHAMLVSGRHALAAFGVPPDLSGKGLGNATIDLAEGVDMPLVGFGTWQLEGARCTDAVRSALAAGVRHLDTAQGYENEKEVGLAIMQSGVPRKEIFLATKLSEEHDFGTKKAVRRLERQLKFLNTSYVDVYMLHSPSDHSRKQTLAAWRGLEQILATGKARAIGVSNFQEKELKWLIKRAQSPPTYIQNKLSPYYHGGEETARSLPKLLQKRGIRLVGYSVINPWPGLLNPLQDPTVLAVAERHQASGVTPAQILHRWALQVGAAIIPKASSNDRIKENSRLFHFVLTNEEMALLSGLAYLAHKPPSAHHSARTTEL